jgi:hypothetical protein
MCHQLRDGEYPDKFALAVAAGVGNGAGTAPVWPPIHRQNQVGKRFAARGKERYAPQERRGIGHDDRALAPADPSAKAPPSVQRGSG